MRSSTTLVLCFALTQLACSALIDVDELRGGDAGTPDAGDSTDGGLMDAGVDADVDACPPGGELCGDGVDNDCDDAIDEADAVDALTFYPDADMDTFGDAMMPMRGCVMPAGMIADGTDCDDGDPDVRPSAAEVCDGVDNDCSGIVDDHTTFNVPRDFATIVAALAATTPGAEICVGPGTYSEPLVIDQSVTLVGAGGADVTSIDVGSGSGVRRPVRIVDFEATLVGFTLSGGGGGCPSGCGLAVHSGRATVSNCVIRGNRATGPTLGAGVEVDGPSTRASFFNTIIRDNDSDSIGQARAGGLYVGGGATVNLHNVVISGNRSSSPTTAQAAGLMIEDAGSTLTAENLLVAGNVATLTAPGTAVAVRAVAIHATAGTSLTLTNVTVHGNQAESLGMPVNGIGVSIAGGATLARLVNVTSSGNSSATAPDAGGFTISFAGTSLSYCNVFGNSGPAYGGSFADPTGTMGNVSVDPMFTDVAAVDPNGWDLTLMSGSTLIDAGDPAILDPDATTSDIGAYGGPGTADW